MLILIGSPQVCLSCWFRPETFGGGSVRGTVGVYGLCERCARRRKPLLTSLIYGVRFFLVPVYGEKVVPGGDVVFSKIDLSKAPHCVQILE